MRIVCLEEHLATPAIMAAWREVDPRTRDFAIDLSTSNDKERRSSNVGDLRTCAVDEAGVDVARGSRTLRLASTASTASIPRGQ